MTLTIQAFFPSCKFYFAHPETSCVQETLAWNAAWNVALSVST